MIRIFFFIFLDVPSLHRQQQKGAKAVLLPEALPGQTAVKQAQWAHNIPYNEDIIVQFVENVNM